MSIVTTPLNGVSLEDWDAIWSHQDTAYELVRGIPIMAPTETFANNNAALRLVELLRPALHPQLTLAVRFAVHLGERDGRHTVREPDVVALPSSFDRTRHRADAAEVAFVAEVVSPGSVETDWITKRDEYAAAGIPSYLVIDVRADTPYLVLFDRLVDGRYTDPDPHADHTHATLTIGEHPLTIRATDLA